MESRRLSSPQKIDFLLNIQQFTLEILLTLNRLLNILIQAIKIHLRNLRVRSTNEGRLTRFCFTPIRKKEFEGGDDAAMSFFTRVFHYVNTKLNDVAATDFERL